MDRRVIAAALVSLVLESCSSRPREFTPELGVVPADQMKFDAAYAECKELYTTGKLNAEGRLASGGAGAAAGTAVGAVGTAAATTIAGYGGLAVMSATLVLMPVAVVGGAIGMAKIKRNKKEKAIQTAVGGCLQDRGYQVVSWQKAPKAKFTGRTVSAE